MALRIFLVACALLLGLPQCRAVDATESGTHYDAWLECPGGRLRFGLELSDDPRPQAFLINGLERIAIPVVEARGADAWLLSMPHYDSTLLVRRRGSGLEGEWTKVRGPGLETRMVFGAELAATAQARDASGPEPAAPEASGGASSEPVLGRWSVAFADSEAPAVGVFDAGPSGAVLGTFLTELGDYRFLAGDFDGQQLELSCFDGAHAFLFRASLEPDGTLSGDFWSRDTWHETWTAQRDEEAQVANPFELSAWTGAVPLADLAFPDLDGRLRSLDDEAFAGRVRLIQLFGSWCPNCHDEAPYLVELDRRYRARGLSILGLAFELTGDLERDTRQVQRFKERYGVEYPILVAGIADKQDASKRFPLLDRVRAYPTTIFLDSAGVVRQVHTGFSGPATGPEHELLRASFESLIEELLTEEASDE